MTKKLFRYSARLPTCFSPPRIVFVHQRMEADIMAGLQQMAQFMNHHMLHAPFRQQQQVSGKADVALLHVANTPTRYHRPETDSGRTDTHLLCMPFYHRFYQRSYPLRSLHPLSLCRQWQLTIKICPLPLSLSGLLSGLRNPFQMLVDERLHLFSRQTDGCRHMHIAILHDAHRQPSCPSVCHLYSHCISQRNRCISTCPLLLKVTPSASNSARCLLQPGAVRPSLFTTR